MRIENGAFRTRLIAKLRRYSTDVEALHGLEDAASLNTFVFQIIESVRRIRFVKEVAKRNISPERRNPRSEFFDPIRAAILEKRTGNFEEACWLVFLFTHFGKNLKSGYQLLRDVYGKLGNGGQWTWPEASGDPIGFRYWLDRNLDELRSGRVHRAFGNHRKYQSLHPWKSNGTGSAVESYVKWIKTFGSHKVLFETASDASGNDPEQSFRWLYRAMAAVNSFGRTARFDYLSMIGKLELADIRPDSVYFGSATGPLAGAKLLFRGSTAADASGNQLEVSADRLAIFLQLDKQVMEDSLCNWQKSPKVPITFRG